MVGEERARPVAPNAGWYNRAKFEHVAPVFATLEIFPAFLSTRGQLVRQRNSEPTAVTVRVWGREAQDL